MAQTIAQVVTALAASDKCAIVSMRSPKFHFDEIFNDYASSTENRFATLEGVTNDQATRLVIIIDRMATDVGSGAAKVERRV